MFEPITSPRSRAEFREYAVASPARQAELMRQWAEQSHQADLLNACVVIAANVPAPTGGGFFQ